jgi:hypothetical protein
MRRKILLSLIVSLFSLMLFVIPTKKVFAAKSPKPRITEIVGIYTSNIRVHFQIKPIKAGEIIKVNYQLKPEKFNDVKYKAPKSATKNGTVNAAASATGSAIDLYNLPKSLNKFIQKVKVRIKVPGKSWSSWSNTYSM